MEVKDSGEWEGREGDVGGVDRVRVCSLEESEDAGERTPTGNAATKWL